MPANAIWLSMSLSILLNLIILGSTAAFNALMSLQLVALMATYMISISCVLWRRVKHPETLPLCRWSLGRWGVVINTSAILYSVFAFFFCFWPMATPVDRETMNWSPVMFVGGHGYLNDSFHCQGQKGL
jgi:amino acid transporter